MTATAIATTLPTWAAYTPATDTTELPAVLRDPAQFLPNTGRQRHRLRALLVLLLFAVCAVGVAVGTYALTAPPAQATDAVLTTVEAPAEPTGHGGIR
jgi:hypothetical protein